MLQQNGHEMCFGQGIQIYRSQVTRAIASFSADYLALKMVKYPGLMGTQV
ncbi:MAG: hypothetical protein ACRC8Y_15920 [Chroococcales cyanobacterium]